MTDNIYKPIHIPIIHIPARGCGKTMLLEEKLKEYSREHPEAYIVIIRKGKVIPYDR